MERVKDRYDVVVIDSAPLLAVADTLAIAPHVSAAVLVVSMRETNRRSLIRALQLLQRANVPVLGLVANMVMHQREAQRAGYGYGYGYGAGDDRTTANPSSPSPEATRQRPRPRSTP